MPAYYSGSDSEFIGCAPLLNTLIVGISSVDCVQIFSLHGMVLLFSLSYIYLSHALTYRVRSEESIVEAKAHITPLNEKSSSHLLEESVHLGAANHNGPM